MWALFGKGEDTLRVGISPQHTHQTTPMTEKKSESTERRWALDLRHALYGGIISCLGATVGWFLWAAVYSFLRKPTEILYSGLVGGILGLAIEGFRHYREVGRKGTGGHAAPAAAEGGCPPRQSRRRGALPSAVTAAFLTMLTFIAITGENILAELMKDVLKPLAASLITLFPVGVLFGWVFYGEHAPSYMVGRWGIIIGMAAGLLASLAANGVYLLMGVPVSEAISSWWMLIGTSYSFVFISRLRTSPAAPLLGLAISLTMFVAASVLPFERYANTIRRGPVAATLRLFADTTGGLLTAPEVPAKFWDDAEDKISQVQSGTQGQAATLESPWGTWLAERARCVPGSTSVSRKDRFCTQLQLGWHSGLARSWVVIAFFSLGLGVGRLLDERWRPDDYSTSRVWRIDRALAIAAVVLVVIAALLIRLA